jgi:plastocyanin
MRAKMAAALLVVGLGTALNAGCGSDDDGDSSLPSGFYISISNMSFAPLNLAVPPGATVTVLNRDAEVHSVTSEATAGAFTPGGVAGISFDTGLFTGTRSFTIPSSAVEGTVVPYYCSNHLETMTTPTGRITVMAGAQPGPAPGGGGGGGGY